MRVNVLLEISRGIFVCGKIIQMHTIHESNYTVIKLPRNGKSNAKNKFFFNQFTEDIKHN